MYVRLFLLLYLFANSILAQKSLDSINLMINNAQSDSLKFEHLYSKIKIFRDLELLDSANSTVDDLIKTAGNDLDLFVRSYYIKSTNYSFFDDFKSSEKVLKDCLTKLEEKDTLQFAKVNEKIAMLAYQQGNIPKCIQYFFESLKYYELLGTPLGSYRALAILYGQIEDIDKAFYFNQKVIDIALKNDNKADLARAYLSQGYQYKEMKKYVLSFEASSKSVDLYVNELNTPNEERLNLVYGNLVDVYLYYHKNYIDSIKVINPLFAEVQDLNQAVLDTVELYIKRSIEISDIKKHDHFIFNAHSSYGDFLFYINEYKKSLKEYLKSYFTCKGNVNMLVNELTATRKLVDNYKVLGNKKKALFYLEKNVILKDSTYNSKKKLELGKLEGKLEAEAEKTKQDLERKKMEAILKVENDKERAIELAQAKKRSTIIYSILIVFALLCVLSYFIFKKLKLAREQAKLISTQKKVIENDRNTIRSSIEYSKIIQKKIFPTRNEVTKLLPDSFIYFAPKDIVSGDFYWVFKKGNKTFFSVADCTGHGVSGAFMTLIGLNLLNAIILEEHIVNPAQILEEVNIKLKERLSIAKHDKIKHGLDIAMCAFNHDNSELEYAGLHNPMYLLNKEHELHEIKGDNLFLGITSNFVVTNHKIEIKEGDTIYLCTDGFVDQKGGEKGKKFYYSRLRNSLRIANSKPIEDREKYLKEKFQNWKGEIDQVDDVCIMGIGFLRLSQSTILPNKHCY